MGGGAQLPGLGLNANGGFVVSNADNASQLLGPSVCGNFYYSTDGEATIIPVDVSLTVCYAGSDNKEGQPIVEVYAGAGVGVDADAAGSATVGTFDADTVDVNANTIKEGAKIAAGAVKHVAREAADGIEDALGWITP